jgi:hypothetical protein
LPSRRCGIFGYLVSFGSLVVAVEFFPLSFKFCVKLSSILALV